MMWLALLTAVLAPVSSEKLIWSDEFEFLDFSKWKHEVLSNFIIFIYSAQITMSGGGNWEFEYYMNNRSNSYTRNSVLYIKPTLTVI